MSKKQEFPIINSSRKIPPVFPAFTFTDEKSVKDFLVKAKDDGLIYKLEQPADGDCLFHSFATYLGNPSDYAKIRKQTIEFEQTDPEMLSTITTFGQAVFQQRANTKQEYFQKMKKRGEWGGVLEIIAFSNNHNLNVVVIDNDIRAQNFRQKITFPNDFRADRRTIFLFRVNRIHYEVAWIKTPEQKQAQDRIQKALEQQKLYRQMMKDNVFIQQIQGYSPIPFSQLNKHILLDLYKRHKIHHKSQDLQFKEKLREIKSDKGFHTTLRFLLGPGFSYEGLDKVVLLQMYKDYKSDQD